MKYLLLALLLSGCSTVIYEDGRPIARIQSDARNVTLLTRKTYFHADTLDHSTPTRAAGSVIGTATAGAAAILMAAPALTAIPVKP